MAVDMEEPPAPIIQSKQEVAGEIRTEKTPLEFKAVAVKALSQHSAIVENNRMGSGHVSNQRVKKITSQPDLY